MTKILALLAFFFIACADATPPLTMTCDWNEPEWSMGRCDFTNPRPSPMTQCGRVVLDCTFGTIQTQPFCVRNVDPRRPSEVDVVVPGLGRRFYEYGNTSEMFQRRCPAHWEVVEESSVPVRRSTRRTRR